MDNVVKELLKKLKALAERGVGGEKINAEMLLSKLMQKHNISENDIADDIQYRVPLIFKSEIEKRLGLQILCKVCNTSTIVTETRKYSKGKFFVLLTASERLQYEFEFDFYSRAFRDDLDALFLAFVHKNNIFSQVEIARAGSEEAPRNVDDSTRKAFQMMGALDRHELRKQLNGGSSDD